VPERSKVGQIAAGETAEVEQCERGRTFDRAKERRVILGNVVSAGSLLKRLSVTFLTTSASRDRCSSCSGADRVLSLSAAGIASANRARIWRCDSQETEHAELRRHARSGIQTAVNAGDHLLRSAGDPTELIHKALVSRANHAD
jgi:hypothetical protein